MADTRYLERRGARFYIRVRVPADLRGRFGKLEVIEKALGTGDLREAQRRRHSAVAAILEQFQQARRAPSPEAAISEAAGRSCARRGEPGPASSPSTG